MKDYNGAEGNFREGWKHDGGDGFMEICICQHLANCTLFCTAGKCEGMLIISQEKL